MSHYALEGLFQRVLQRKHRFYLKPNFHCYDGVQHVFVFKFKIRVDIGPNRQVVNYIPSTLLAGYDLRCMLQDSRSGALLSPFLSFNTFLTIAAKKEKSV